MNLGVYFYPEETTTSRGITETQRSRTCVVFSIGRKYAHAVTMDHTSISCVEIPKERELRPMLYQGKPYPIQRAAKLYLGSAVSKTERAATVLRNLLANVPIEEPTTPDQEVPA